MSIADRELSDVPAPAFSGATIDRVATLRDDPTWVGRQLQSPAAVAVGASRDGVLVRDPSDRPALVRRAIAADEAQYVDPSQPILLGLEQDVPVFAVDLEQLEQSSRTRFMDGGTIVELREAGTELPRSEGGLAAYLAALAHWHRVHRFCANCGRLTAIVQAGYARRCPSCGATHFPRTDPVVIMLVEHGGQLLLGRRPGWPPNRYSVLAGFVSPGESAEEAVIREVREESGIEVHEPRFVTSQPWPFPSSLMLGFEARSDGGEPVAHDGELEDVAWFPLQAIRTAQQEAGPLRLPPPISIARHLIERWAAAQA